MRLESLSTGALQNEFVQTQFWQNPCTISNWSQYQRPIDP